jgi:hypothetical protein
MKSEVYRREVDTSDELLDGIMDATAHIKDLSSLDTPYKHPVVVLD